MKPVFKQDEIVIENPYKRGTGVDLGEGKLIKGEILYVGENCTLSYKIGDTILVESARKKELKHPDLEKELLIFPEKYIMCTLDVSP